MNNSLRLALIVNALALIAGSASGKPRRQSAPEQILSVRLSNEASVPAGVLRWATEETSRCFRSAKIQIAWERLSTESPEDQGIDYTIASSPHRDERPYILIRLVRGQHASAFRHALGFALPFAGTGAHVVIFYDRVEALTGLEIAPNYMILGDAMAHELGHVLLGPSQHANAGLMQACWNPATLRLASAGLLGFESKESARIRAAAARWQARQPLPEHQPTLASSIPDRLPGGGAPGPQGSYAAHLH
jgi:hypothetical protein